MGATTNRQWLLVKRPDPPPATTIGEQNFRWVESPRRSPADGQFLVRNLWLSFDPTQLLLMNAHDPNAPATSDTPNEKAMPSLAVSQVVESRHPDFRPGELVHGHAGWEDFSVLDGHGFFETAHVPAGVPPNLAAGTLGATGMAAYFGVVEVGHPEPGETFVVSSAAGGVGSVAGQIARIRGARVIGIAGGRERCDRVVRDLGFDAAIDHRTEDVAARLGQLAPEGIDVYFDNSGGPILDEALGRLRAHGRVVLCGATSQYSFTPAPPGPSNYLNLVMVNGRMEGLLARDYAPRFPEAISVLRKWIDSGQLRSMEDIVVGLEHAPRTLARLYSGTNVGKQLLKIADAQPTN